METRECTNCLVIKPLIQFYKRQCTCKSCKKDIQKEYYHNLPADVKKERNQKSHLKHRSNPEAIEKKRQRQIEYEIRNKEKRRIQRAITRKKRYWEDLDYRIEILLRTRLYKAVKRNKMASAKDLVGCTSSELRNYIESMWKPEMTWGNYGTIWEIDHIIPICTFDLSDLEAQKKCFHYMNLQPLFRTTDIAKSFGYDEIGNQNKRRQIHK